MDYTATSGHSNLTASDILDIRRMYADGNSDSAIANAFGIHRKTVYNIVNRKTWREVPTPVKVRGFSNYQVYPDGRVFSTASQSFVKPLNRTYGQAVRIQKSNGERTTVPVSTLLQKGFGNR